MNRRALLTVLALAAVVLVPAAADASAPVRRVMNIVNFVRGCEPRCEMDLVTPLREEIALNTANRLPNTILLQYDAMLRDDLMDVALSADRALTEYGVWIETCRQLVEKVGLAWRGRKGFDWDWYINPGFLMAYSPAEREKLVDEIFRLFRERTGAWPKSVGSWLLDAHSMDYMVTKYGVKGFCICREQDDTDAYGLRGGYSNGAYYPSKKNMLSAATDMSRAVKAPVFRMLTPDPIYNYSDRLAKAGKLGGCPTLEPVWPSGARRDIVDWYFRVYTGEGLLNLSYMQTGQENSFGWTRIGQGLPYQIERIVALRAAGTLAVERMCDTAERFTRDHPQNCPQTQVALEDWNGREKSVWYNSRFYRANLHWADGKLRFRDIHKMCDEFEEPFLTRVCTGWQALYYTPPVVDEYLFGTTGRYAPLDFAGNCTALAVETPDAGTLVVKATVDGRPVTVRFDERGFAVTGGKVPPPATDYTFQGFSYSVAVTCADGRLEVRLDRPPR